MSSKQVQELIDEMRQMRGDFKSFIDSLPSVLKSISDDNIKAHLQEEHVAINERLSTLEQNFNNHIHAT